MGCGSVFTVLWRASPRSKPGEQGGRRVAFIVKLCATRTCEYMGRPCSFWDELCKGVGPGRDSPGAILEAGCHSPKLCGWDSDLIGFQ